MKRNAGHRHCDVKVDVTAEVLVSLPGRSVISDVLPVWAR
jgi:hypothetical protein